MIHTKISSIRLSKSFLILSHILILLLSLYFVSSPMHSSYSVVYSDIRIVGLVTSLLLGSTAYACLNSKSNRITVFSIFSSTLILIFLMIFLPQIRGVHIYGRGDTLAHHSWILSIIQNGSFPDSLIYPIFHINTSLITLITDISTNTAMQLTIFVLSTISLLFLLLIIKNSLNGFHMYYWPVLLGLFIWFPFRIYNISYYPYGLGTLFLPVVVYSIVKMSSLRFLIVFILIILSYIIMHPIHYINSVLLLGTYVIILYKNNYRLNIVASFVLSIFIIGIIGYVWYDTYDLVSGILLNLVETITHSGSRYNVEGTTSVLGNVPLVEFLALRYGPIFIMFIFTLYYFVRSISRKELTNTFLSWSYFWGVLSIIIGILTFFATSLIGPLRFVDGGIAIWVGILVTLYCIKITDKKIRKKLLITAIVLIILLAPMMIYTAHPSPLTYQYNWHTTHEDASTTAWISEHHSDSRIESLGMPRRMFMTSMNFDTYRGDYFIQNNFHMVGRSTHIDYNINNIEIGDKNTLNETDSDILLTNWHSHHADNKRLVENREIDRIQKQFNSHGSNWLSNHSNVVYNNGENKLITLN